MTPEEITDSMCRGSMWRGFAEKIEAKPKRPDKLVHFLHKQAIRRDKNKAEAGDYLDRLYNRWCRFLSFRLTKYGVNG